MKQLYLVTIKCGDSYSGTSSQDQCKIECIRLRAGIYMTPLECSLIAQNLPKLAKSNGFTYFPNVQARMVTSYICPHTS